MFKFALKNMAIKKLQIILVVLSVILSAGTGVLAYNVATQVEEGITYNAAYYSVIVGPAGSDMQLATNSMYFTGSTLGTIPYTVVEELQKDMSVTSAIPFAMADRYKDYGVVGTTAEYLDGKKVAEGEMFSDSETMQVVLGYAVAKSNGLSVGDVIHTSHSDDDDDAHAEGLTVVGILEQTHSKFDKVVFTQIRTLWKMHDHGEHDDHDEAEDHEEEEEHEHLDGMVCAVMVKTKNQNSAASIIAKYDDSVITEDGATYPLQAIEPMAVMREVLDENDNTKFIVYVLCAVILAMNVMIISIITLLNTYHSAKEIALMRLIGISMKKINLLYVIQNGIIGLISTVLAFGLSRLCLLGMDSYVSDMGVVLNLSKVYPMELVFLVGLFIISILPTVIWIATTARKDGATN